MSSNLKFNKPDLSDAEIEVRIAEYLLDNPKPNDLAFHGFAAGIGIDKDRVEEVAYRMLSTVLHAASQWEVLNREDSEINTLLYMCNVRVEDEVDAIEQANPKASTNMAHLCVRIRNVDNLRKVTQQRNQVLSYAEEHGVEDETFLKKLGDQVIVTDPNRITYVNNELNRLGMGQKSIDSAIRLLELDKYVNESALLNGAYNTLRESLIQTTDETIFDDEDFAKCAKLFEGADTDRRDYGQQIRVAKIREVCRIMRDLTARYGISNRGLFSGFTGGR